MRIFPSTSRKVIFILGILGVPVLFQPAMAAWGQQPIPPPLIIGVENDYPPFSSRDESGNPTGLTHELVEAVAREAGLPVEVVVGPWPELRTGLIFGDLDAVAGVFYSTARDRLFDFTQSFVGISHAAFHRSGSPPIERLADLAGSVVAVMHNDIMHDLLAEAEVEAEITTYESITASLSAVAEGAADYALVARVPGRYLVEERGLEGLVDSGADLYVGSYTFAVPEGNLALRARLQDALLLLSRDGRLQRITERWIARYQAPPRSFGDLLRQVGTLVLPLLAIVGALVAWTWLLRRRVRARTRALQNEVEQHEQARRRLSHINRVLASIRMINRLINQARDAPFFLGTVCRILVENRGYVRVMIVLEDADGRPTSTYHAGFAGTFEPMAACLRDGYVPRCRRELNSLVGPVVTERLKDSCGDCPVAAECGNEAAMSVLLKHGDRVHGFMSVVTPRPFAGQNEERQLLAELASDLAFAVDDLALTRHSRALQDSLSRTLALVEHSPLVVLRRSTDAGFPVVSATSNVSLFGYDDDELAALETGYLGLVHPEDAGALEAEIRAALEREAPALDLSYRIRDKTGEYRWVEDRILVTIDGESGRKMLDGVIADVTSRVQQNEDLRFQALVLNTISDRIVATDLTGRITYVNAAACRVVDRSREELLGRRVPVMAPGTLGRSVHREILERTSVEGSYYRRVRNVDRQGQEVVVDIATELLRDTRGRPIGFAGIGRDVTGEVQARMQLEAALEEKNTLLRELHHRTKNNMQIIASMLALRRYGIDDEKLSSTMTELEAKIHGMALVHTKLYQSGDLSRIDLREYLEELADLVVSSVDGSRRVHVDIECEEIPTPIDTAVPLGLVVNELMTNAIKHAFPGKSEGRISILLRREPDDMLLLEFSDDGIGLPPEVARKRNYNLGLETIDNIVRLQLRGRVDVETVAGTRWIIRVAHPGTSRPARDGR